MKSDLFQLSATEALQHVHDGDFTVSEWVNSCLEQIERIEPSLKAWAYLDPESALQQAATIDAAIRREKPVGRLCGAPVGVKDIFNTRDMPTQMGSPLWAGFTPGNDARVVFSLRRADAVIPGKTVTAEFAVHAPGPTTNPHNPEYMAGTSSTGSAVAVASYMVPLALGTQTAGSTIRPASYCGVYGFKPSFGLIPRTGMLKTTDSLDTVGFFARTLDDLGLLFEAIRVRGRDYPISESALGDYSRQYKPRGKPWRIGLVRGPKWNCAEPYARQALCEFAEELGLTEETVVEEVVLPEGFDEAHATHATIYDRTLAYYFREECKQRTLISEVMYEIIGRGEQISLEDYKAALDQQFRLSTELDHLFCGGFDAILNLSTGGEAPKGRLAVDRPDNCLVWTLCGVPAINLPVFQGPNHLPFGAQIVARRFDDYRLLQFAQHLRKNGLTLEGTHPRPDAVLERSTVEPCLVQERILAS
jgi:Asp-tRNA(Asn)/Glu-tRNA(Gln) amidotransferase A subunit family amidase